MTDDGEMGRPARHERTVTRSQGAFLGNVLTKGRGERVRVRGTRRCGCGAQLKVDFSGPEDSMGASIARSQLAAPVCEKCIEREDAEQEKRDEAERRTRELRLRLEGSGLPGVWRSRSLDELREHPAREQQAQALSSAKAWARGEARGLVMHGEVGRGKTVIAAAATVERCAASAVRWLRVGALLMDLRMPFDAPEYARAQRALNPGSNVALVLDDLDKLRPTEHQLQPLYVAINGWVEACQPLLVTLNRDLDELAEWMGPTFGPPIASRLAGYADVVEIKGRDWRIE